MVWRIVAEAGGDAALRRDGVAAGREHLGDAGGLQPRLCAAHGGAQAGAAGADDDGVVDVVDDQIGKHTSELQSLMRISYAVFFLKNKNNQIQVANIAPRY